MVSSVAGKVTDIAMSAAYNPTHTELSLGIFVMKTLYLRALIEQAEAYNLNSLTQYMLRNCKSANYRAYKYKGYVAPVTSFLDFYKCSIELATNPDARSLLLGRRDAPVFTRVHNSTPVCYKQGCKVEKGAVVKNSVLFKGTHVGKGATVNCIVTDKDVYISDGVNLSGNDNMPFYVQKSRKI